MLVHFCINVCMIPVAQHHLIFFSIFVLHIQLVSKEVQSGDIETRKANARRDLYIFFLCARLIVTFGRHNHCSSKSVTVSQTHKDGGGPTWADRQVYSVRARQSIFVQVRSSKLGHKTPLLRFLRDWKNFKIVSVICVCRVEVVLLVFIRLHIYFSFCTS